VIINIDTHYECYTNEDGPYKEYNCNCQVSESIHSLKNSYNCV